jgi:metal-responsive CopG/Arc/MetJ family transcriptional regulator
MGRPPLDRKAANTTRIQVLLPKSILKRIDALAGENGRGKFLREAAEALLKKRERQLTLLGLSAPKKRGKK